MLRSESPALHKALKSAIARGSQSIPLLMTIYILNELPCLFTSGFSQPEAVSGLLHHSLLLPLNHNLLVYPYWSKPKVSIHSCLESVPFSLTPNTWPGLKEIEAGWLSRLVDCSRYVNITTNDTASVIHILQPPQKAGHSEPQKCYAGFTSKQGHGS